MGAYQINAKNVGTTASNRQPHPDVFIKGKGNGGAQPLM